VSALKKEIKKLLGEKDFEALRNLPQREKAVSVLTSLSYDKQNTDSWRAIEAIGLLTQELAGTDPDRVRNIVGRLLWMIRDESGGIGWSVPEILGEVVRNNPELCSDIAPIIASFHEELMLTSGVLWALSRIGRINSETAEYALPIIRSYLNHSDARVRGCASLAAGAFEDIESLPQLEKLKDDPDTVTVYVRGSLTERTVGDLAAESVKTISGSCRVQSK
jgi:HEAT repeat protein